MPKQTEHSTTCSSDNEDKPRLYGVLSHALDVVWEEVKPLLERALAYTHGKFRVEDVRKSLEAKEMQLWVVYRNSGICGVIVTQIIHYPTKAILRIHYLAGHSLFTWIHLAAETIFNWGRDEGCQEVEVYGRKPWLRVLKRYAFKPLYVAIGAQL